MKNFYRALMLALPFALVACGQSSTTASLTTSATVSHPDGFPAQQVPSLAAARQFAHGFDTGNLMSARQVFIFFDPQCPHCGHFWSEAKSLSREARFTWVPVGLLNPKSSRQATALLGAPNPAAAMDEHESRLLRGLGGMDAAGIDPAFAAVVERNTRLLASFGATGVPFIVSETAGGESFAEGRAMPGAELAAKLGWKAKVGAAAAIGAAAVDVPDVNIVR